MGHPILIYQGGKDFRVPIGQGQEAFQAAITRNKE
jgi:dipeptidyl aminopeptidase/acylaminoacyl peptidase